jgi:hypothetical protein
MQLKTRNIVLIKKFIEWHRQLWPECTMEGAENEEEKEMHQVDEEKIKELRAKISQHLENANSNNLLYGGIDYHYFLEKAITESLVDGFNYIIEELKKTQQ